MVLRCFCTPAGRSITRDNLTAVTYRCHFSSSFTSLNLGAISDSDTHFDLCVFNLSWKKKKGKRSNWIRRKNVSKWRECEYKRGGVKGQIVCCSFIFAWSKYLTFSTVSMISPDVGIERCTLFPFFSWFWREERRTWIYFTNKSWLLCR